MTVFSLCAHPPFFAFYIHMRLECIAIYMYSNSRRCVQNQRSIVRSRLASMLRVKEQQTPDFAYAVIGGEAREQDCG
jgi:hypothetical protein